MTLHYVGLILTFDVALVFAFDLLLRYYSISSALGTKNNIMTLYPINTFPVI